MSDESKRPEGTQPVKLVEVQLRSVQLGESLFQEGDKIAKPANLQKPIPVAIPHSGNALERGVKSSKPEGVSAPKPVAVPPAKPVSEKK